MPEIEPEAMEINFFAAFFMLNILCDVIYDNIDKHVYI